MARRTIVWLRNDLRLHDHATLAAASAWSKQTDSEPPLLLYVLDPRVVSGTATTRWGSRKVGAQRAEFLLQSLADLRRSLSALQSGLVIARGLPERIIPSILSNGGTLELPKRPHRVFFTAEPGTEEAAQEADIRSALSGMADMEEVHANTLYPLSELPMSLDDLPHQFTAFRKKVEAKAVVSPPLRSPSAGSLPLPSWLDDAIKATNEKMTAPHCASLSLLPTLADLAYSEEEIEEAKQAAVANVTDHLAAGEQGKVVEEPFRFVGGETAGLKRLSTFIWQEDRLRTYFDTRNGMLEPDHSTKLSPWLAHGCLSPRYIVAECQKYEEQRTKNKSTYWLFFELLWRDFLHFFAFKLGAKLFHPYCILSGAKEREARQKGWRTDEEALTAWKEGRTGIPLVDANMRELRATGYMSNRGRQNVASFLVLDVGIDWRLGADYFESVLLDHDVASNWGNWAAAAGVTGGRLNRFNITKQSGDYDPEGAYIKRWCPELRDVPAPQCFAPWTLTPTHQAKFHAKLGRDYPRPIIKPSYAPHRRDAAPKRRKRKH